MRAACVRHFLPIPCRTARQPSVWRQAATELKPARRPRLSCRLPLHLIGPGRVTPSESSGWLRPARGRLAASPSRPSCPPGLASQPPVGSRSGRKLPPPATPTLPGAGRLFRRPPPGKSAGGFCSVRRCPASEQTGCANCLSGLAPSAPSHLPYCAQNTSNTLKNTYTFGLKSRFC